MPVEVRTKAPRPESFINQLLNNRSTASPEAARVQTHPLRTITRVLNAGSQARYDNVPTAGPPILGERK
jgi:hypothetical protein